MPSGRNYIGFGFLNGVDLYKMVEEIYLTGKWFLMIEEIFFQNFIRPSIYNNYYDYYVKYDQILPIVDKELSKLSDDYIYSMNDNLINSNPEYLLIQEYDSDNENETDVMKDIINNKRWVRP